MDDDEQHFVVLVGQRMLRVEQLVEIQILRVAQGLAQVPMHLPRRSNRRTAWPAAWSRSCSGLEDPARHGAPAGQQLAVEAPVVGLEPLHQAPEARRNDSCAWCAPVRGRTGSAPPPAAETPASSSGSPCRGSSSCPSGCAGSGSTTRATGYFSSSASCSSRGASRSSAARLSQPAAACARAALIGGVHRDAAGRAARMPRAAPRRHSTSNRSPVKANSMLARHRLARARRSTAWRRPCGRSRA